ncbi:ABC transporter substrate-binding protein [Microlunatus speluncae]|uniref:ABC transporter substrate-binding protein n=1 Tax=Microlunatus speluncae TaxID=2594267 RepID=UPI0012666D9C|nr:iron-siderophore ABC transporter substrate-binding protein [Microlunatus speluncae]
MGVSRLLVVIMVGVATLLAGCSAGAAAPPASVPAPQRLGPTAEPGDEVCGETRPATGPTTIEHAMGSTVVPEDPQRIIVLDSDKLDTVCALGLQDRLVGTISLDSGQPGYLGPTIKNVPSVGKIAEPDLEKIASLQPDLILGSKFRQPDLYDRLSQIAPTVYTELVGLTWQENFLLDASALRRADQGQELLQQLKDDAAAAGSEFDGANADASIVRFRPGGIRLYGPTSFSGSVLELAGVSRPEFQQLNGAKDRRFVEISAEELPKADGKIIYVTAYGPEAVVQQDRMLADPIWQTLGGVKSGRVFLVSDEVWMTGIGVIAADGILRDLRASLG